MPALEIDNLTLFLLILSLCLLGYARFSGPQPLVHPLLLGKQSEVSAVRKAGESGVYRSFATGQGTPLMIRPASTLKTIRDVVQPPGGNTVPVQRDILGTPLTNEALAELVRLLPIGLRALFPHLSHSPSSPTPILVLLPPSPSTSFPSLLLALASSPAHPIIVLPEPRFLIPALESTAHPRPGLVVVWESIASGVVEQVYEMVHSEGKECGVLVVGDQQRRLAELAESARTKGLPVRFWDDVWEAAGENDGEEDQEGTIQPEDIHAYFYCSARVADKAVITKFSHMNFTAGVAALLSLFPANHRPSEIKKDTVASSESLTTPIGMTVALASIWSGASFILIGSDQPNWPTDGRSDDAGALNRLAASNRKPSLLFLNTRQHLCLTQALHGEYQNTPLAGLAANSKLAGIHTGYVARDGVWEKLVWRKMRNTALNGLAGDNLRGVVVLGETPSSSALGWSTFLLSLPTSRALTHANSAGPLLVSHFFDIQSPGLDLTSPPNGEGSRSHTGAPACNAEVVLRDVTDVEDDRPEQGVARPIVGKLYARGPALGEVVQGGKDHEDGWRDTSVTAAAQTNGTFIIA